MIATEEQSCYFTFKIKRQRTNYFRYKLQHYCPLRLHLSSDLLITAAKLVDLETLTVPRRPLMLLNGLRNDKRVRRLPALHLQSKKEKKLPLNGNVAASSGASLSMQSFTHHAGSGKISSRHAPSGPHSLASAACIFFSFFSLNVQCHFAVLCLLLDASTLTLYCSRMTI